MQRIFILSFLLISTITFADVPVHELISPADYIDTYKEVAMKEMSEHGIPASIILGQGMVESNNGNSSLAVKANNHFGLKCHKEWHGATYTYDDDAPAECFRKYISVTESYNDHSIFIKSRPRYGFLFNLPMTDYKSWANGLKDAGYATHPDYAQKLIKVIERYRLYELDQKGFIATPALGLDNTPVKNELPVFNKHEVIKYNSTSFIILKKGDTYDKLAREFNTSKDLLIQYNDNFQEKDFYEGGAIYLAPKSDKAEKSFHIVGEDETMESISLIYAIDLNSLYEKNRMKRGDPQPKPGTMLYMRKPKPLKSNVAGKK